MQTERTGGTKELRLDRCIQVFDDAMTPEFCLQMIDSFNNLERLQVPNGRGHKRGLEGSAWTELNITPLADPGFKGYFLAQIDEYLGRYNQHLDLTIPVPNRPRIEDIRIKRYRVGADEKI